MRNVTYDISCWGQLVALFHVRDQLVRFPLFIYSELNYEESLDACHLRVFVCAMRQIIYELAQPHKMAMQYIVRMYIFRQRQHKNHIYFHY